MVFFKLKALRYLENEAAGNVTECARKLSVDTKRITECRENRHISEQQGVVVLMSGDDAQNSRRRQLLFQKPGEEV